MACVKSKRKSLEIYLVIGDENMGKSSVLRHIWGGPAGRSKKSKLFQTKYLRFTSGKDYEVGLQSYSSLQEEKIKPNDFIAYVNMSSNCPGKIIVALRKDPLFNCPDAKAYVSAFQNAGWTIVASVLLITNVQSNRTLNSNYPKCINVYSSLKGTPIYPTNVVAIDVRKHFKLL